jgi:hypothetical protein
MDKLIFTAVSGAERLMRAQQVHANNLANMDTSGLPRQHGSGGQRRTGRLRLRRPPPVDHAGRHHFDPRRQRARDRPPARRGDRRPGLPRRAVRRQAKPIPAPARSRSTPTARCRCTAMPLLGEGGPITLPPHTAVEIGTDGTISVLSRRRDHDAGGRQAAPGECRRRGADQERGRPDRRARRRRAGGQTRRQVRPRASKAAMCRRSKRWSRP